MIRPEVAIVGEGQEKRQEWHHCRNRINQRIWFDNRSNGRSRRPDERIRLDRRRRHDWRIRFHRKKIRRSLRWPLGRVRLQHRWVWIKHRWVWRIRLEQLWQRQIIVLVCVVEEKEE